MNTVYTIIAIHFSYFENKLLMYLQIATVYRN